MKAPLSVVLRVLARFSDREVDITYSEGCYVLTTKLEKKDLVAAYVQTQTEVAQVKSWDS